MHHCALQKDGFDLDLTFVTERVIAMSFPSSGFQSFFRNPIQDVSRFFNTKYPGKYKIYNLCSKLLMWCVVYNLLWRKLVFLCRTIFDRVLPSQTSIRAIPAKTLVL